MSSPTPSPKDASAPPPNSSVAYTLTHLDTLLATYLHHLDAYTTARTSLSTDLSSGFFSLAQAQRSSMLPPGQRYGRDMYDERMKAGRRLRVNAESRVDAEEKEEPETETERREMVEVYEYVDSDDGKPTAPAEEEASKEDTDDATPLDSPTTRQPQTENPKPKPKTKPNRKRRPNPIAQFALLPPQSLRASQSSFISAVQSSIPSLLNAAQAMRRLEAEIGVVRAALGLHYHRQQPTNVLPAAEEEGEEEGEAEKKGEERGTGKAKRPVSQKKRQSLPSRQNVVGEPRSRVLKLGS